MSKIICDICGTVYPDNATVCPICGYPRQDSEKVIAEDAPEAVETVAAAAASKPVKGGRFSNKNVKKRNQTAPVETARRVPVEEEVYESPEAEEPEERDPNKPLLIVVAVLAAAVVLLGAYIGMRFFRGADAYDKPEQTTEGTTAITTEATTLPEETGVPCVGMTVSNTSVRISRAGGAWLLGVTVQPQDTTDEIVFASSDDSVATVDDDGRIVAVAPGTAVITVTCGEVTQECTVLCEFEVETEPTETTEEPTETTEETTEPTTEPEEDDKPDTVSFKLDRSDVTLRTKGESFTFGCTNNGSYLNPSQVKWSSSNESVATVANGKVTAVASGTCTITATYSGQTQKCIVRCNIKDEETEPTETTEDNSSSGGWSISASDVTISVGESFTLKIVNEAGETASVNWSASKSGVVSVSGNKVTGEASGMVTLSATVDGQTFECIVRVK